LTDDVDMAQAQRMTPGPGQESVWDYPRPPALEPCDRHVEVMLGSVTVAESDRGLRVLETAGPPTIYLPPRDVRAELLRAAEGHTVCEWKGKASYFDVACGDEVAERAAWTYSDPKQRYAELTDHVAFYPGRVECFLDGERARPQPGEFYGGWITDEITGPFKGEPGSEGW
jgi:uncharacterized protein (DUF427 family)